MGIDPGSIVTGYGVVEARGARLHHIASAAIRIPRTGTSARLGLIYEKISDAIRQNQPDAIAVEKVFMARNARSALILGQARGAALVACGQVDSHVHEYSALEIKKAVVGRGRADKFQVQHMIRVLLGLREALQADAADALACAICHINHARSRARYESAAGVLP
ncbi:MAG: Crossover junction endodeoxyribonuclease RuvC [Gammaproteobacteria bacterium]|nr:Crossover junction endodeoxyribonuclease RuvC [Gammaproteobacteria bacterium]